MEKKAFIIFDFDTKGAISNIQEAQREINILKQRQAEVKKESGETSEEYIKLSSEIKTHSDKVRENKKALEDNMKIQQASEGSVEQMRKTLSAATAQWKNMSQIERENTEAGKKLKANIKGLTDELKRQEGAIGDNRRNVGNYKSAMEGLSGPVGNATKGVSNFSKTLMANPIGAIVMILMSLFTALQKNEKIIKAVDAVTASFNAALSVLTDTIIAVWDALKNLDFSAMGDAISGVGGKMAEASKQAYMLTKAQQALKDATNESNEVAAKNEVQIQRLLQQAKDKTKSDQERIEALKKAQQLEQEAFDATFKNARREFLVLQKLASLSTSTAEEKKKVSEAQIRVYNLEAESVRRQEKIQRELNTLENEILGDKQKRSEEAARIAEKRKAEEEKELTAFKARIKAFNDERESDLKRQQIIEAKKAADLEQWREKRKVADMSEEERKAYLFSQEIQRLKDLGASEMEILRLQNEEKIRVMQELGQREVKEKELTEKAKQELEMATFMATVDLMDATGNLMEALGSQSEEAFEIMKQIDTASALIKGFLAVQKTLADPLLPFPSNVIAATAIGLTTAANVVKIQSVKPKFSEGGNIDGASHEMGGVPIEAEGGEVVINKQSSKKWWKELDFINRDMGGRGIRRPKFALGGNVGATDGGYNIRQISQPVSDMARQNQMISNSVKEAVSSVNIVTRVTDIRRVDKADNFAKSISELR
jgi:hypothetical protein